MTMAKIYHKIGKQWKFQNLLQLIKSNIIHPKNSNQNTNEDSKESTHIEFFFSFFFNLF